MRHFVSLKNDVCCLRPELTSDIDDILGLWNASHVIGNLWMSKTSRETFLSHQIRDVDDDRKLNWVITDFSGSFIGTIGISEVTENSYVSGRFAMWPTDAFNVATPFALLRSFTFDVMKKDFEYATYNIANHRIKRYAKLWGVEFTGELIEKKSSSGDVVILEKTVYTREKWNIYGRRFLTF